MKCLIFILATLTTAIANELWAQSIDMNYIKTETVRTSGNTTETAVTNETNPCGIFRRAGPLAAGQRLQCIV